MIKLIVGIAISAAFLYLAFGRIEIDQMKASFLQANYWYLIPAFFIMLFSHWARAVRLRYLIHTDKKLSVFHLFAATMIGYAGNTVLPAHLGEVIRANVIGHRYKLPTTTVLATLLIERLIDTLTVLVLMVLTLIIYPFPKWVTQSGYILAAATAFMFLVLYLLKIKEKRTYAVLNFFLSLLPRGVSKKIADLIDSFVNGISGLKRKRDIIFLIFYSILIWTAYWLLLVCVFLAFDLFNAYNIHVVASLVLLVITVIAIIVPSSPGYIGTYHFLCQFSLGLFGVPESVGLSFAFVAHAINTLATAAVGGIFAWKEGVSRFRKGGEQDVSDDTTATEVP